MKKLLLSLTSILALWVWVVWAAEMAEWNLFDVTKGETIRNVNFANTWVNWDAMAYWDENNSKFTLHAGFTNLPEADWDDFYEGWLVQKSPFKFISTGEITLDPNGKMINHYESNINYSSYDFYVLTLEPNDWDPAPADHIVEGTIPVTIKSHSMMKKDNEMMKHDSMMKKDDMMKSNVMETEHAMKDKMMMKKEQMKTSKYYAPIKKLLSKYNPSQLQKIQKIIPKLKEIYTNKTDISEDKKMRILEIIDILDIVLAESIDTMMEK